MKRILVALVLTFSAGLAGPSPAWADCLVNTGTCEDGNCLVNTGDCKGWCTVNTGTCDAKGSCAVNHGSCTGGSGSAECALVSEVVADFVLCTGGSSAR